MKQKFSRGSWLLTAVLVGASAAYLMLVFSPNQQAIGTLKVQLRQRRQYITAATALPIAIEKAKTRVAETLDYTRRWSKTAPAGGDLSSLFGKIHRQIQLAGATVTQFEPRAETPMHAIRQVPVFLVCQGAYAQVARALVRLDELPGTIWIESVELKLLGESGQDVRCEVNLVVFTDKPENSG